MAGRGDVRRVCLAYSGGLDTSVILRWLIEEYGCEVVAFTCDVGQEEELDGLPDKAKATLKEISKSSKPTTKKPEKKKPEVTPKDSEPQEETAATLLAKAKRYVESGAYEVAQKALKEIISKYPDTPEAKEAQKLLEEVESEM